MPWFQGSIRVFNIMLQFFMQYSVNSSIWHEMDSLVKGVLGSWFYINSMLECDANIYAYNDILYVCMLLICCLCIITTMFMRDGDQVKPWSLVQLLIINSLVTFAMFTFSFLNLKITKKLVTCYLFCKLVSCWCLTTTKVSWGCKVVCFLLQIAWRTKKRNQPQASPRVL
jgi:hypothetical protein